MVTALIHQPEYLPWIGFWNRLAKADIFVALDTATHQKHGFVKRNRVKTQKGVQWIGVPLSHESSFVRIQDLQIDNTKLWRQRQIGIIEQSYKKAPYFKEYIDLLQRILAEPWEHISDLNMRFYQEIGKVLGITTKVIRASDLQARGKGTDLLIAICKEVEAAAYLSGPGKREGRKGYLEMEKFDRAGIQFQAHEFVHPKYDQQFMDQGFIPFLSALDLLFNKGSASQQIIGI